MALNMTIAFKKHISKLTYFHIEVYQKSSKNPTSFLSSNPVSYYWNYHERQKKSGTSCQSLFTFPNVLRGFLSLMIYQLPFLMFQFKEVCELFQELHLVIQTSNFTYHHYSWSRYPLSNQVPPLVYVPPVIQCSKIRPLSHSILHMIPWNSPNEEMNEGHIWVWSNIK